MKKRKWIKGRAIFGFSTPARGVIRRGGRSTGEEGTKTSHPTHFISCAALGSFTFDPTTKNTISTRLFAQDLAWGRDNGARVGFRVEKYEPSTDVDRTQPADKTANEGERLIEKMSQSFEKTCVIKVTIELRESVGRAWEGISEPALAKIRGTKTPLPKFEVRDSLITCLEQNDTIELYFTSKSAKGYVDTWTNKLGGYMRDLLSLAKYCDNFWFYRTQCMNAFEQGVEAMLSPEFPELRPGWVVPRWLVQEWAITKTTTPEGSVLFSDPQAYRWAPLDFPENGYPNVDEAAFLLKMGVREERNRQDRDLRELVQSVGDEPHWFKGRFRSLDKKKRNYVVEVFLGVQHQMEEAHVNMPAPGTRIRLEVDRVNATKPSKKSIARLDGVVVYDALETSASFICVVNVKGSALQIADNDSEYHMFISYIVDHLPHERMMDAIARLQIQLKKDLGPDSRRTILGCRAPATNTDVLKKETKESDIVKFENAVMELRPQSNKFQLAAALQTCKSESGNVVIVGPPGTGKTDTIQKIAHGHGSLGRRVISLAPMNSAVHTLVDKFLDNNAKLPVAKRYQDHEWVYFTGGSTPMAKAADLRTQQTEESALQKANQKLFGYLRDARARSNTPRYEQTLGHKLRQRIDVWAADPKYDEEKADGLHSKAKSYLDTLQNLPFIEDKEQRSRAKKHIEALEYNLSRAFMLQVKFSFSTLSSSYHELLLDSGDWDVCIMDESARDTRAGIAVAAGALRDRVKLFVWAGDHHQGEGIIVGRDSNVGYNLLSRGVFASLAESTKHDQASPCEVFMLQTCYRMEQALIDWSNKFVYRNMVQADRSAGRNDMPLRRMLELYWKTRLHNDYEGQFMQIGLDVTDIGIKDEFMTGTTTRLNRNEAMMIALTVIDMLIMDPPADDGVEVYRRISGSDFFLIANFTGQVLEIQRAVRERAAVANAENPGAVKQEDLDAIWYSTTANCQSKERPIVIYGTTVAPGMLRLPLKEHLPIGFVADIQNLNVSVTRCMIARYTVSAFQLLEQMKTDGHRVARNSKHVPFFEYVNDLVRSKSVISLGDSNRWFTKREKPAHADGFTQKLAQAGKFTQEPEAKVPRAVAGAKPEGIKKKTTATTGKNPFQAPPPKATFAGDRDAQGNLKAQNPLGKKKHRGGKGGTKKHRKTPGGDDDDDAGAGAGATAAT